MERPSKRQRLDLSSFDSDDEEYQDELSMTSIQFDTIQDPMYQLDKSRAKAAGRLKSTFEDIFAKYGKDFDGDDDTINFYTDEIEIDNGHVKSLDNLESAEEAAATSDEHKTRSTDRSVGSGKVSVPKPFAPAGSHNATIPPYSPTPRGHDPHQSTRQHLNSSFPLATLGPSPAFNFGGSLFGNGSIDPVWQAPELPPQAFHYATGYGRWGQAGPYSNSSPYLGPKRLASAKSFAVHSSPTPAGANGDNAEEEDDILRGRNMSGVTVQTKEKELRTGFVGGLTTKKGSPEFSGLQGKVAPSQSASLFPRRGRRPKSRSQPVEPLHGCDKGNLVEDSPPPSFERKIEIILPRLTTPDLEEYRCIFPTPPHVSSVAAVVPEEREHRGRKRQLSADSTHVNSVVVPVFHDMLQVSGEQPGGSIDFESIAEVRCDVDTDHTRNSIETPPPQGIVDRSTQVHIDSSTQPENTSNLSAMTVLGSATTPHDSNMPSSETGRSLRSQKSTELYSALEWPKRRSRHTTTATGTKAQSPTSSQSSANEPVTDTALLPGVCRDSDIDTMEHAILETLEPPRLDTVADEDRAAGEKIGGAVSDKSGSVAREESEPAKFPASSTLPTDESAWTMSAPAEVQQKSDEDTATSDGATGPDTETLDGPELSSIHHDTSPSVISQVGDVISQQPPKRAECEISGSILESPFAQIADSAEMSKADYGEKFKLRSNETRDSEELGKRKPVSSNVHRSTVHQWSKNPDGNRTQTSQDTDLSELSESGIDLDVPNVDERPGTPDDHVSQSSFNDIPNSDNAASPDLGSCSPDLGQGHWNTVSCEDAQRSPSLGAMDQPDPVILNGSLESSWTGTPRSPQPVEEANFDGIISIGRSPSPELGTASGAEIIREDTPTSRKSNPTTPKRVRKPKPNPETRRPTPKRLTLTSLIPDDVDDDSDELSLPESTKTPTSRWSNSRTSSPQPSSRISPRKSGRKASLLSDDRFPSPPATDSRALVGRGKVRSGNGSGVHSSPLARTVAYRLLGTPRRGRREESLVRTPRGSMKKCGQDGYVCDRDFCFTCCK
ncbi:hypothetical protein F5Y18DRAFT_378311 [Xylariaceae sp. FL1019]|nr:hypothetical protein F5Y18DRAFT_378311 [Xylariaceae sp. FL1019]